MSKLSIPEELKKRYDIPQRDLILYSITGIFGSFQEKGCAAFGGYFRYDVESRILFDGQLIDRWGASVIHGEMNDEILEFEKMYHHDKNRFNYNARGSLYESIHWLHLLFKREKISKNQFNSLDSKLKNLSIKLNNYIQSTIKRKIS